jgi:uncharacterized protein
MKLELTKKSELVPRPWTGGMTIQLAIFPKDASYVDRNFQFRLSTSEVSLQECEFTALPGVSRVLLVLEGEIRLHHPGRYAKVLKKFDTDNFMGDWQTKSSGKGVDFNLMTTVSSHGHTEGTELRKGFTRRFELLENHDVAGIYAYKGDFTVHIGDHKMDLSAGDNLLIFTDNREESVRIYAKSTGEVVLTDIQF